MSLLSTDPLYETIVKTRVFESSERGRSPQSYLRNFTGIIYTP
jgi:hypothetical protein